MNYILRRRGLGLASCEGITTHSEQGLRAVFPRGIVDPEVIFRWGCTSTIPRPTRFEVNLPQAIHTTSDKGGFRAILGQHHLCPPTWFIPAGVEYPCIVRPRVHSQGRNLFVCPDAGELLRVIHGEECMPGGWYASKLIDKEAEFRVFVAQGRVVAVAQKFPANPQAVAWNHAQGSRFVNVKWGEWPLRTVIPMALQAMTFSGLDFGGVDIIIERNEPPAPIVGYVLEINSAPSLLSLYRTRCMAKVFDYIVQHGKETIPPEGRGWRQFIHPALLED